MVFVKYFSNLKFIQGYINTVSYTHLRLLNHVGGKAILNGELELNININYANRKLTLWASNANDQEQPVAIPEQENETITTTLTTSPSFDLALRKYITKINGDELIGQNTRVPSIAESTLQSGTTATYNHKKDPVAVETCNIVTYNITIYNEEMCIRDRSSI